jgi:hypothetical protein
MLKIISVFVLSFLITVNFVYSADSATNSKHKDTICVKYRFYPGDELTYSLTAFDSISINRADYLWKQRNEKWIVKCDSTSDDSIYYLTLSLIECYSIEYQGIADSVEHNDCNWLGRSFGIAIDSIGNRISFMIGDTINPGINPGGPFQPYLFFPFGSSCNQVGFTSLVKFNDFVPENGLPVPLINQTFLTKHERRLDTLGYKCSRIQLVQTSQGSITLSHDEENPRALNRSTSILNGHASLDISDKFHIPVHLFFTVEQKLTLHYGNNKKIPGSHYNNSFYKLINFKKSPLRKSEK